MEKIKKVAKAVIGLLALVIVLDAVAFFVILFAPETPLALFLARHEPVFNILKERITSPAPGNILIDEPVDDFHVNYRFVEGTHTVKIGAGIPVYAAPSRKSKVIKSTEKNYSLKVVEEQGSWLKVKFPSGEGWVNPDILYGGTTYSGQSQTAGLTKRTSANESRKTEWEQQPGSSYFDFLHIQQRPLMFDELAEDSNPIQMNLTSTNLNLQRLRKVTSALGNSFVQGRAGQFVIRGKDDELVDDAALILSNFKENYASVFGRIIKDPLQESMIYVYILPDLETYRKFYPSGTYEQEKTSGHYETGIIVTYPDQDPKTTLRVLVHEATHHFNHLYLGLKDTEDCTWLDEGLATYIGLSGFTRDNQLKPGEVNLYLARKSGSTISTATPAGMAFYLINKVKSGKPIGLERILYAIKQDFYSVDSVYNYGVSWILVHYLLHSDNGSHRESFFNFLKQAQLGNHSVQQLETSLGLKVPQLEAKLKKYVLRLDK